MAGEQNNEGLLIHKDGCTYTYLMNPLSFKNTDEILNKLKREKNMEDWLEKLKNAADKIQQINNEVNGVKLNVNNYSSDYNDFENLVEIMGMGKNEDFSKIFNGFGKK